jgi:trehalose 6-phosphate synthase/phosphatase
VSRLLKEHHCYPIYIEDDQHELVHGQLLEQHLWCQLQKKINPYAPLEQLLKTENTTQMWVAYHSLMQHFTNKIVELYQFTYMVWIHGYELQLLPSMVRRKISCAKIGYFFHSAFPPTDIWLAISRREELLKGVLGANQIGFHTNESSANFLSSCCRILGFNYYPNRYGRMCLNVDGNEVCITSIHKGVDIARLYAICDKPDFLFKVSQWTVKFGDRIVVGGIRSLNDSFDVLHSRNKGFEQFLEENDQDVRHKMVLQLIGIRPKRETEHIRLMTETVVTWARQVNARYNYEYIRYEVVIEEELPLSARLAFFAAVDILVNTAME